MKQKSVMAHQFSQVPNAEIQRSSFDRSHGLKTTFDGGLLVPIFVDEALPGDSFSLNMTGFARLATPIFPTMDNMFMETFFFAVPIRLVWDNWEKFNGEQRNPGDSTDFVVPVINYTNSNSVGSLADYMGIPVGISGLAVNCLHQRAYNLIYNEWFRDQNLQDSVVNNTGDGPDGQGDYELLRRGKRHDYFTSRLPFAQKGDPVTIPLGQSAPVVGAGNLIPAFVSSNDLGGVTQPLAVAADDNVSLAVPIGSAAWGDTMLEADLSTATATTINALRQAFQVQRLLERDARGGTRYTEVIRAHFGVTSPDSRLQRPEFLGGGSSPVNITPVANTVPTDLDPSTPQGTLAGFGTATLTNHGFTKSFTEHCVLIGLISVRADLTYQQGLNRMWSRQTRFDFYWPALSHIGEQAVLNQEIYAQGTPDDQDVFGYQERYAEYRYKPSQITGLFRSSAPASLDAWHLAQEFANLPVLGAQFIEDNPPIDRIISVQAEPHFLFDSYFQLRCARPMPLYGVPGMIDHF